MNEQILVSVIVPVYNVEKYLKRCIDSICNQSYQNLEIILVDDGSVDKSGDICDRYARMDTRIQVIHKQNGGLSDARNVGIAVSKGAYISLIDSDDYIDQFMIEKLLQCSLKKSSDITICQYQDVYSKYTESVKKTKNKNIYEMTGRKAIEKMLVEEPTVFVVAWNKLYKSSLFKENRISYPKGYIHEDCFTTYQLFFYANKVSYIYEPLYLYMHRDGSIMQERTCRTEYMGVQAYEEIMQFVKEKKLHLETEAEYRYILANLHCIQPASWKDREYILKVRRNIMKINWKENSFFKKYKKYQILLLCVNPRLYCIGNRLMEQGKRIRLRIKMYYSS